MQELLIVGLARICFLDGFDVLDLDEGNKSVEGLGIVFMTVRVGDIDDVEQEDRAVFGWSVLDGPLHRASIPQMYPHQSGLRLCFGRVLCRVSGRCPWLGSGPCPRGRLGAADHDVGLRVGPRGTTDRPGDKKGACAACANEHNSYEHGPRAAARLASRRAIARPFPLPLVRRGRCPWCLGPRHLAISFAHRVERIQTPQLFGLTFHGLLFAPDLKRSGRNEQAGGTYTKDDGRNPLVNRAQGRITTGVPTRISRSNLRMSWLRILTHPCDTRPGINSGLFVP